MDSQQRHPMWQQEVNELHSKLTAQANALREARGAALSLIHASSKLHDAAITSDFKFAEVGGEYEPPDGSIMDAVKESVAEMRKAIAAIDAVVGKGKPE